MITPELSSPKSAEGNLLCYPQPSGHVELQTRTKAPAVLEALLPVAAVKKAEAERVEVFCSSEHCFGPFFSLTEASV